jgi:hypothetical protein
LSDPTVVPFPQDGRSLPPAHLSSAEAEVWRAVIASRPAGFFGPEIFPVLEAYCTTASMCDHVAVRLRGEEGIDHALLATYDQMTGSLTHLAETLDLLPGAKRAGA